jgi:Tfp pilus assembly protein PilF
MMRPMMPPTMPTIIPMMRLRVRTLSLVSAAVLLGSFMLACGGDEGSKKVNAPQAGGDAGVAPAPAPATGGTSTAAPDQQGEVTGAAKGSYDNGFQAWKSGDLAAAKKAFTDATREDSRSAPAHYALGAVLERLGDASGAQQEYRAAFAAKSDFEPAIGAYALSLANGGHMGEADTFLTDKHQRNPNSPGIESFLAEVKSLEKDSGDAQQLAQDALRLNPDFKPAMVTIARDHYRAGRLELARYALQAILDGFGESSPPRDQNNPEAHLLRGLIEKQSGQRAAALTDFEAARAKRPDLVEAVIQVGVMKLEAGNVAEATPLLEGAVRFAPNSALAHLNLGDAYRLGGRPADAKKEFDTALSLDSTLAVAHYDLGLLYLFSPNLPGTNATDQVTTAIRELNAYKTMRGTRPPVGTSDDIDELLSRANAKLAELKQAAAAPPPPPPSSAAPKGAATPASTTAPKK